MGVEAVESAWVEAEVARERELVSRRLRAPREWRWWRSAAAQEKEEGPRRGGGAEAVEAAWAATGIPSEHRRNEFYRLVLPLGVPLSSEHKSEREEGRGEGKDVDSTVIISFLTKHSSICESHFFDFVNVT